MSEVLLFASSPFPTLLQSIPPSTPPPVFPHSPALIFHLHSFPNQWPGTSFTFLPVPEAFDTESIQNCKTQSCQLKLLWREVFPTKFGLLSEDLCVWRGNVVCSTAFPYCWQASLRCSSVRLGSVARKTHITHFYWCLVTKHYNRNVCYMESCLFPCREKSGVPFLCRVQLWEEWEEGAWRTQRFCWCGQVSVEETSLPTQPLPHRAEFHKKFQSSGTSAKPAACPGWSAAPKDGKAKCACGVTAVRQAEICQEPGVLAGL